MKRTILFFALFVLSCQANAQNFDVQLRYAFFIPQDSHIRSVYSRGVISDFALEVSTPLKCLICDPYIARCMDWSNFTAWGNLSYFEKQGHSRLLDAGTSLGSSTAANNSVPSHTLTNRSRISNWALNFGAKYYFGCKRVLRPYVGFGVGACHVCYKDHNIYVKQEINQWGFCFLAKSGVEYQLAYNLFLDLFADYSFNRYCRPHSKHGVGTRDTNTGGLKLGLGLGYHF